MEGFFTMLFVPALQLIFMSCWKQFYNVWLNAMGHILKEVLEGIQVEPPLL